MKPMKKVADAVMNANLFFLFCLFILSLFCVCRLYSGCVPCEPKYQQGKVFFNDLKYDLNGF